MIHIFKNKPRYNVARMQKRVFMVHSAAMQTISFLPTWSLLVTRGELEYTTATQALTY